MVRKQKPIRKKSSSPDLILDKFGLRFVHHAHSGKHLPLRYTSYSILFFLIAFASLVLLFASNAARAYDKTSQGGIGLQGISEGQPPQYPATITSPVNRAIVEVGTIVVQGTCQPSLFVELYRNSVLAGGALCTDESVFKMHVTLVPGKNDLQTRSYDGLKRYAPDSEVVSVWYNVPLPPVPILLVYTVPIQKGIMLGQPNELEYVISGGDSPYAASVDWGDGSMASVAVHQNTGTFKASHKYEKAGQYVILLSVTDERGTKALFQSIAVVHSADAEVPLITKSCRDSSCLSTSSGFLKLLDWAWPSLMIAFLMTLSFWIGERVVYSEGRFAKLRRSS